MNPSGWLTAGPWPQVVEETWLGAPALSYARRPPHLPAVLATAADTWPERVLFRTPSEEVVRYGQFAGLVAGAVAELTERGLRAGDVLAVAAGNGLELAVAQFACATAGLVLAGLTASAAPASWSYVVDNSGATLLAAQPRYAADLARVTGRPVTDAAMLLTSRSAPYAASDPDPGATYCLVHTSGSTGRPKGCQVVHRASVHSALSYVGVLALPGAITTAALFPLSYISAMHAHVLPAMLTGGSCLLLDTTSPALFVEAIRRHDVTWAYAVPSFWRLVLRLPDPSMPTLTRLGMGGSPWPHDLQETLRQTYPQARLLNVYGLSETHSPACILTDDQFADRPTSVGRPLPCMQARVVDPVSREPTEVGELQLRGSLVTTGYWRDPEASAAALHDGWLSTGDVGRIDSAGYVYVLDRVKDMINRGGHKVFSAEVERVLRTHPGVADAAVVGRDNPLSVEDVVAFVVPVGPGVAAAELRRLVASQLSDHAVPRFVHLVPQLPRNATGKVDKPALRRQALTRPDRPGAQGDPLP